MPAGQPFRPLRIALAHGGFDVVLRVACPLCSDERRRGEAWTVNDEQHSWLVADPQTRSSQPGYKDYTGLFQCQRKPLEHRSASATLVWQVHGESEDADIVVTTVDTMHRRLMDRHGIRRIFGAKMQAPRLVVLDEMHIYEGQTGSHAAQIVRRLRQRIRGMPENGVDPVMVGASATINEPAVLLSRLSGIPRDRIGLERPLDDEGMAQGLEHFLFVQSPGNRLVDPYADDLESDRSPETAQPGPLRFVSEQATMIQAAMCLQHTMKTRSGLAPQKRRVLGFVDSLDVSARLSSQP